MVSSAVLLSVAASAVLMAAWPVAIFVICCRRMTLLGRNVLVGAGIFFVFSQMLEKGLHTYVLQANAATAAWFHAHSIAFALYGCLAAALFEEVGRYLGMRFLVKTSGNPGTAVAYGIGHGGLEAILIGSLAMAQTFFFATLLNSARLDATLGPLLSPDALVQVRAGLEHLTPAGLFIGVFERLIVLLIQIGLSLVVWHAVEKRHFGFLALAVLLHALIDFPAGLFQAGEISSGIAEGGLLFIGLALTALFYRKFPPKILIRFTQQA